LPARPDAEAAATAIRLDKWLWQARFFKTRGLASSEVTAGHVRVNGQRVTRPGRGVGPGDVLTFRFGRIVAVVRILACGSRRGPASEARGLYDWIDPPGGPGAGASDAAGDGCA